METYELAKLIYNKSLEDYNKNHTEIVNLLIKYMPEHLYRYRNGIFFKDENNGSISNNDLDSLENNTIWFSNPKDFNDPFDSRCGVDINNMNLQNFDSQLQPWEVLGKVNHSIERLNSFSFISCFSEESDNRLMWSHYANNHQGYCLEYAKQDLLDAIINYMPDMPSLITMIAPIYYSISPDIWDNVNNPKPALFSYLKKDMIWSYEKEWRIYISHCVSDNENFMSEKPPLHSNVHLQNIKPTKIIMGCKIEENMALMDRLINISRTQDIPLYIVIKMNMNYGIKVVEYIDE